MTGEEKKSIYNFIHIADNYCYGYNSPNFPENEPEFADDIITVIPEKENTPRILQNIQHRTATEILAEYKKPEDSKSIDNPQSNGIDNITQPNQQNSQAQHTESKGNLNLSQKIQNCSSCILCQTRARTVEGTGVKNPVVLVIGEAPSEHDESTGIPFSDEDHLLDKMLYNIQLDTKSNCYVTNLVKCRTPQSRMPMIDEIMSCSSFLKAQIAMLKPSAILTLGRAAFQTITGSSQTLFEAHGKIYSYSTGTDNNPLGQTIMVVPTFHPNFLRQNPNSKKPAWEDLKFFKSKLLEICPDYQKIFNINNNRL